MEQQEYFKSEVTFSPDTYKEIKMYMISSKMKRRLIFCAMSGLFIAIMGFYWREYNVFALFAGVVTCLSCAMSYIMHPKEHMNVLMRRNSEISWGVELSQSVSFLADKIKIYGANSGGTIYLAYEVIERYAETKSTYTLFTKSNLIVAVNKLALIQEQRDGDFIQFLRYKCKNIKPERKYF